jgi:hypothetical protein
VILVGARVQDFYVKAGGNYSQDSDTLTDTVLTCVGTERESTDRNVVLQYAQPDW